MSQSTPRASVPLLAASQAQKHVTHNEALLQLDALLNARLLDRNLAAPPASFADGDAYLVAANPAGLWAGQAGKIAFAVDGAWRFYAPFVGLSVFVADEAVMLVYTAGGWVDLSSIMSLQNVPLLGVNTTADATNKFALKANAALFAALEAANGGTGDMRVTLNKETAADTASFLFQDNFSGRAEFGLTGDDDFHIKVSQDAVTWNEALKIARASGAVTLPKGQLGFPAVQNASTDPNTLDDYEEGSFTPTVFGSTTAGTNTYSVQVGRYTKIGNKVLFQVGIVMTAKDAAMAGNVRIGGLPFLSANVANLFSMVALITSNVIQDATKPQMFADIPPNVNYVQAIQGGNNVAVSLVPVTAVNANSEFYFSGSYQV